MSNYTKPEWSNSALVIIDTQCDTLDGQPFEIPGTSAVLPNLIKILKTFRALEKPVIHVVRIYRTDGSNVDLCRRTSFEQGTVMLLAGSPGCQIAPELLPDSGIKLDEEMLLSGGILPISSHEVAIYKPRWGAFYKTPLEQFLREQGISTLVFCGCNFPNCPRTSIYEASERDFRIVVADDAISGLYDQGRQELKNIGVEILSSDKIINAIEHSSKQV